MATITDVAKLAGVSVATVSRVINGIGNVQPAAMEAVQKAIETLKYCPNSIGRNLRKLKTNRILVLQPSIANPFFSRVVRGIDSAAAEAGYQIILSDTNTDPEREAKYLALLDAHVADGAILTTPCYEPSYYAEIAARHPLVLCSEDYDDMTLSSSAMDNTQGGYDATKYLLSIGHRKIGFLGVYGNRHTANLRLAGYRQALADMNIAFREDYVVTGSTEGDEQAWDAANELAKQFVAMKDRPTAIFCTSDIIGIGAIHSMREAGLRVPEDMSVFSFDDIDVAKLYDPALSTMYIPKYAMGQEAVHLLLERMHNPFLPTRRVVVQHRVTPRASTRPLTPEDAGQEKC